MMQFVTTKTASELLLNVTKQVRSDLKRRSWGQKTFPSAATTTLPRRTCFRRIKGTVCALLALGLVPLIAVMQSGAGELRVRVQDPEGARVS